MVTETVSTDDVFLTKNSERSTSATMQRILNEMGGADQVSPILPPAQPGEPGQPSKADGPAGAFKQGMKPKVEPDTPFWTGTVPKILKDVAYGTIAETVPQAIEGGFDYMRHAGHAVGEFGDFLDRTLPQFMVGTPEEQAAAKANREALRKAAGDKEFSLHGITGGGFGGQPTTVTGGIIRGISEFMSGYSGPLGLLKAGKIPQFLASPLAGGVSMFLGSDPDKPNLTNMLVGQFPSLKGPISDVFATNAEDGPAINRLRNAAEGVGGTVLAEAVIKGIVASAKFANAMRWTKGGAAAAPGAEGAPPGGAVVSAADAAEKVKLTKAQELVDAVAGKGNADLAPVEVNVVPPTPDAVAPNTRVYHGSTAEIKGELRASEDYMLDRSLGVHVSKDPEIANTFAAKEGGHVTPLDINESKFLPVEQPRYESGAVKTDQRAIEQMVMKEAYTAEPEMLERYLVEARALSPEEAKTVAADMVAGKSVKLSTEGDKTYTLDSFLENYGGKPYNASDRGTAVQLARESWQKQGYEGLKYENTSPMETAGGVQDKTSYVLFDAEKAGKPFRAEQVRSEVGSQFGPDVPGQVTGKAVTEATLAQTLSDIRTKLNWENIEKGNTNGVIGEIAGQLKGKISEAKRGEITLEAQTRMADALGMTQEELIGRQIGQALNSEQIIAAGQLMQASDERLLQLAIKAQGAEASVVDAMRVNEAMITHMALIEQFLGATGEAGRALGALRAVHKMGTLSRARGLAFLLEQNGGEEGVKRLSQMIVDLQAAGKEPGAINAALGRSWGRWSKEAIQEATAMGYLWRPKTQVRNIIGNAAMAIWQSVDRYAAERISVMMGESLENSVVPGEALAYVRGQLRSFGTAFEIAGKAFKTGERQFEPLLGGSPVEQSKSPMTAASVAQQRGMSAAASEAFVNSNMGKAVDLIGGVQRLPGRFLTSADDFFKVVGYSGEIEAQAHRQAMAQGLKGEAYVNEVAKLVSNPSDAMHLNAVDHALYVTFNNNPGKFATDIMRARNNFLPMYMVLPYIRTPTNLFKVAMEHSPIAPALDTWKSDIAQGGAPASLALAKITTGYAAMAMMFDFAHNGHLTGPMRGDKAYNEAQQGAGLRPISINAGGMNIEISGLGQIAPAIAFTAAVNELMTNKDIHPEAYDTLDELIGTAASIIAYSTSDQSYLQGLSRVFSAIGDSGKTSTGAAMGAYLRDLASSQMNLIPGVAGVRAIGNAMDPQQRQISSMWDALLYKDIPFLSDKLIPVRDVTGHEVKPQPAGVGGMLYNAVIPFRLSWKNDHPLYNELVRLHAGIERIQWKAPFQAVDVNFRDHPEVLDMYRRLAGNELKFNPKTGEKIGFEDFINRVISGKDPMYSPIYKTLSDRGDSGTDSGKAKFIKEWAQDYRTAAQRQIMSEAKWRYPDFYAEIKQGQLHRDTQQLRTYSQGVGVEQAKSSIRGAMERNIQAPLPDRFGSPAIVPQRNPTAGGFTVPSQ